MKFLRDVKERIAKSKWFGRLKSIRHIEIILAVLLAVIALSVYFVISANEKRVRTPKATSIAEMTIEEARVSEMINAISGVGKARVLITEGDEEGVVGVVVVAENAEDMYNRIKIIRCVATATGAGVDQIEIFEMEKGG